MTLYINGKKVKSIPVENYPIKSMNEKERKVHIGYNNNSNYPVSNSGVYLNELRMWNVARSEEDITKKQSRQYDTGQATMEAKNPPPRQKIFSEDVLSSTINCRK
jgi:hypothetical protein